MLVHVHVSCREKYFDRKKNEQNQLQKQWSLYLCQSSFVWIHKWFCVSNEFDFSRNGFMFSSSNIFADAKWKSSEKWKSHLSCFWCVWSGCSRMLIGQQPIVLVKFERSDEKSSTERNRFKRSCFYHVLFLLLLNRSSNRVCNCNRMSCTCNCAQSQTHITMNEY